MIISKKVDVKIGNLNYKYYKNLEYTFSKVGDIINVDIKHLTNGSTALIKITCDYCGCELTVPYKRYIKYTSVSSNYSCSKKECSNEKIKDVCRVKYGVDNPFQSEEVKEKSKNTLLSKYGVDHPMLLEETKNKIRETCKDRYGLESYMKTDECKTKIKDTCLERYGVEHSSQTSEGQERRKQTRINNGSQMPDHLLDPYKLYRKRVDNISDRNKKQILEEWDGFDYYDGEYIMENLSLDSSDNKYPTIDHKISVMYGFINGLTVYEVSHIKNLCVTKGSINFKKGPMCELEFKKLLKIKKGDI